MSMTVSFWSISKILGQPPFLLIEIVDILVWKLGLIDLKKFDQNFMWGDIITYF